MRNGFGYFGHKRFSTASIVSAGELAIARINRTVNRLPLHTSNQTQRPRTRHLVPEHENFGAERSLQAFVE
jgi:hypothetical protein